VSSLNVQRRSWCEQDHAYVSLQMFSVYLVLIITFIIIIIIIIIIIVIIIINVVVSSSSSSSSSSRCSQISWSAIASLQPTHTTYLISQQ